MNLLHLCFVDDHIVVAHGDFKSNKVILKLLGIFQLHPVWI